MFDARDTLPITRPLPPGTSPLELFEALSDRPRCFWLDSSSADQGGAGRYSFLSADPLQWLTASVGDPDPWERLERWCRDLPADHDPRLPPFQGGLVGLIGYEAATWLEPITVARHQDLPTAALAIGLYDWTIAFDHHVGQAWLISQGLGVPESKRHAQAMRRADEVQHWLPESLRPQPDEEQSCREDPFVRPLPKPDEEESCREGPFMLPLPRLCGGEGWGEGVPGNASPSPHHRPTPPNLAPQFPTACEGVTSNFTGESFRTAIGEIIRRICEGDSFQVNLAQRLLRHASCSSPELYRRLRRYNPAPFAAYFDAGPFQVVSSSPEGFLKVRDRRVETRPIKGTVARTGNAAEDARLAEQLLASEKDRAENVMIVDLMRNDLSRVCEDESVRVTQLCKVECFEHVQHLVSVVEGQLRDDAGVVDLIRACFPGGSVTGAPKVEAMRTIAELEPNPRGPYCGSIGYISCGGSADFNILIRTITASDGFWQIPVGGGITARSDPAAEEAETWTKAAGMLEATSAVVPGSPASPAFD